MSQDISSEQFTVSNNKLFCLACREELATKKSMIEMHIKSQKHLRGKTRLAKKSQHEMTIIEALKRFDRDHHPVGETIHDSTLNLCLLSEGGNCDAKTWYAT